jgi:MoaA/NifB/PqqE/SkfB family radical SAM enzyme
MVTRARILNDPKILREANGANRMVSGLRKLWLEFRTHASILVIAWKVYRHPITALQALQELISLRRTVLGDHRIKKVAVVDGRCYWDLYAPGLGSPAFKKFIEGELNRIIPIPPRASFTSRPCQFTSVFVSMTNRCHLQCEHCFEADVLNSGEHQTAIALDARVAQLKDLGTSIIHITGGEPMLRPADVLALVNQSDAIDYWVLTSGYNFTLTHAKQLKLAGLVGVIVSLDHFEKADHENFRRTDHAYDWAMMAVQNAVAVQLVTALSVCVTRALASEENLMKYARLARSLRVSFVQLLEPVQAGNYRDRDVCLSDEQLAVLDRFYIRMNTESEYLSYPIFTYHGYHHRRVGCFGAGNRNVYLDTYGNLQACPFCQTRNKAHAADQKLDEQLMQLRRTGCSLYASTSNLAPHGN